MTSKLTVLGVVTALLISGTLAFAAVPSEAVGNHGAGNEGDGDGAHEISECTAISEPGQYEIVSDIEYNDTPSAACIDVRASDVSIDGNGHTVASEDRNGTGILVDLPENVTVSNVTVTGFQDGLQSATLAEVTVVNSRFEGNEYGMSVQMEATLTVKDSEVVDSASTGISVHASSLTVVDSELVGNGASGVATALADTTLRNNLFAENAIGLDAAEEDAISENNTYRDNSEAGIEAADLVSTNDVVEGNSVGIRGNNDIWLDGTVVRNNTDAGVSLLPYRPNETFARITDSTIVDNGGDGIHIDADNRDLSEPVSEFTAEIHGSTIADNDGLGVNNTEPTIVNATGNDWGSDDGPGSANDPDAPFEDPVTGHLADGSGDEISEHPERPGVSNVHFTTEPPEERAFQFDLAVGEVIEDIDESEDAYYGRQGRLVRATTMTADGSVTGHHVAPNSSYSAAIGDCELMTSTVDYDSETGEASATFQLGDDVDCEAVTVTFAAYELPGDDTTFIRAHADDQELIAYETITLEPGEEVTLTIDVDE